jgi:RNA polymerase sigma factor (sigma-70 family)
MVIINAISLLGRVAGMYSQLVWNLIQTVNEKRCWGLADSDIQVLTREICTHIGNASDETIIENIVENYFAYRDAVLTLVPTSTANPEREGFNEEWHLYIRKVAAKLYYRTPIPGHEVDDVVQTAWLHIIKGVHSYHFRCRFETWVYQVVVNAHLELLRKASKKPEIIMTDTDIEKVSADRGDPKDPLLATIHEEEAQEAARLIRSCLLSIAVKRTRLNKWLQDHPQAIDEMAFYALEVILGETSQHSFAHKYNLPEPTVSRIFHNLIASLKDEMK